MQHHGARFRYQVIDSRHPDIGREMLEQMAEELRDVGTIEQRPLMEGRALSLLMAPSAKAKAQRDRAAAAQGQDQGQGQQSRPAAAAAPVPSSVQTEIAPDHKEA